MGNYNRSIFFYAHVVLDSRSSIDAFLVINEIEDLLKKNMEYHIPQYK